MAQCANAATHTIRGCHQITVQTQGCELLLTETPIHMDRVEDQCEEVDGYVGGLLDEKIYVVCERKIYM